MEKYWSGMGEYMKGKFWSFCWKVFGWRWERVKGDDALKEALSCWDDNNMLQLPEMLYEVLMKVDAMGSTWPSRIDVVDCGGVCRSWRKTMMEIANRSLVLSGNLTFPISLKQPGSVRSLTRCVIDRNSHTDTFYLYLNRKEAPYHDPKVLLAAKRVGYATFTEYIIFLDSRDISKECNSYVGMSRSNFFGTKFKVYDAHPPIPNAATKFPWSILGKLLARNSAVSSISYELNALGNRGPRKMQCEINTTPVDSFSLPRLFKLKDVKLVLKDKMSRWQSKLWCWCLNLIGRVTFASIKEFELVVCLDDEAGVKKEHENVILQFQKVPLVYTMDYISILYRRFRRLLSVLVALTSRLLVSDLQV